MKELLLRYRLSVSFIVTGGLIVLALLAAYALRFELKIPAEYWPRIASILPAVLAVKLAVFWRYYCFRGWWRYVSMVDLVLIAKANLVSSLILVVLGLLVLDLDKIPKSVVILDGVLCFLLVAGARFFVRAIREAHFPLRKGTEVKQHRMLIVGAGSAGQLIAREARLSAGLDIDLVGFIDDDPNKLHAMIHGLEVLGTQDDLGSIVQQMQVDEIVIAIPSASGSQIRKIVERCRDHHVCFKVLPGLGDLLDGTVSLQQARAVDLNDLLGREAICLDEEQVGSYLRGKRVLITGAGGSIGSELCRQVVKFKPKALILFDNAETPLFRIEQELEKKKLHLKIVPVIGDVRNRSRVDVIFAEHRPEVVFHAAAYKHVPMMERNPAEAVNCNVSGTRIVADAADRYGISKFVMISTDKAVRPTNVMGASKRVAELYVQALNPHSKTAFVTTRFGNVLGSNGSVIPTFKEQIAEGGPVTVTHPDVTRFFMTIPEATQLVLQAGSMGQGGEIYLFDMGQPVKIRFLAEEMIRLSGYRPHEDIVISYTGLRPGEKLYEELLLDDEGVLPTSHQKICIAQSIYVDLGELRSQMDDLVEHARRLNINGVLQCLHELVPEYQVADVHGLDLSATKSSHNEQRRFALVARN